MVTKFIDFNKSNIVWCIVDNIEKCQSMLAKEISVNLSDYMVNRIFLNKQDLFIGDSEDELLKQVSSNYYTHAVIVTSGMSFKLSDRIFSEVKKVCENEFFIAGHILHRNEKSYYKNSYYELHHQFYIINLNDYKETGCPLVGSAVNESHIQIEPHRSEEYLYSDHEVPVWISPGTQEKEYEQKLHGWNIISTALKNNKKLIDLGQGIRDNKKYLYYEYDHVFIRQVPTIYHNQFFCNNFFMPFNSDKILDNINVTGPIDQYITIGTGLNWISNLYQVGFHLSTKVIFTDINSNCLNYMKALVEEWDGEDYVSFYRSKIGTLPNNISYNLDTYYEKWENEWEEFKKRFNDWPHVWELTSQLNFEYVLIDYTASFNFNWIEPNKSTLMNLSDVFNHIPYVPLQSLKYRIACENRLISMLVKKNPEIYLMVTSRAADGFTDQSSGIQKVKDITLTDINLLKKPQWHKHDWNSPKILM